MIVWLHIEEWRSVPLLRDGCCWRKRRRSMVVEAKSHWTHCGTGRSHRWESGNILCWQSIATTAKHNKTKKKQKRDVKQTTKTIKKKVLPQLTCVCEHLSAASNNNWNESNKQTTTNVKAASVAGKNCRIIALKKKVTRKTSNTSKAMAYKNLVLFIGITTTPIEFAPDRTESGASAQKSYE